MLRLSFRQNYKTGLGTSRDPHYYCCTTSRNRSIVYYVVSLENVPEKKLLRSRLLQYYVDYSYVALRIHKTGEL